MPAALPRSSPSPRLTPSCAAPPSPLVPPAQARNKGRISRYLANKCSIASRIDCFSDVSTTAFGAKLKEQVEERLAFYEKGTAPTKNLVAMQAAMAEAGLAGGEKKKKKKDKKKKGDEEEAEEARRALVCAVPLCRSQTRELKSRRPLVEQVAGEKKKKKKKNAAEEEAEEARASDSSVRARVLCWNGGRPCVLRRRER